ncbi:MAG: heme exporter protein CcmB [Actinobacteria bacterium]|nr:heme exporter protein CcmB [Actinomycetota bacterium]
MGKGKRAGFLRQVFYIVAKDFRAELRTKELFNSMFLFAMLALVIFNFSFAGKMPVRVLSGAMWVSFLFASVLGLNRSFVKEHEKGCIEGLLIAPCERSVIYFGKFLGNLLFIFLVELIALPLISIFFSRSEIFSKPFELAGILVLGSFAISAIGTILSAITVNTRTRELLLPILLFPLILPVLIASVEVTAYIFQPKGSIIQWLRLIGIYDIIFIIVPYLLFDYVVEE